MAYDLATQILNLPRECWSRVESFLDEGHYYGWKLQGVQAKAIGDITQCTLEFDQTKIIFLAHNDTSVAPGRSPGLRLRSVWR